MEVSNLLLVDVNYKRLYYPKLFPNPFYCKQGT
jgi:hypothetical protein